MSENNTTPVEPQADTDLDTFSAEFFSGAPAKEDTTPPVEESDAKEEAEESPVEEDDIEDDDTLAPEEDSDESDEEAEEPPKKKNRFQERIDELNGKFREEERQRLELQKKLEELTAKLEQTSEPKPTQKIVDNTGEPDPTATNDDGSDKYPLGEFDPNYIKDLMKYALENERKALEAEKAQEAQRTAYEAEQEALMTSWNEKLVPARERYPDFQEKGQQLLATFEGIDEAYGEYLTSTIMSMDYGPDVLYYLANNVDEAAKIVNSGAAKATIALGRLEAKFADFEEEKQKARPKVSKAPSPPPVNKGSAVARTVTPDTDDLDSFESIFFKKK